MFEQTLIPVGKTKRPVAVIVAFGFQLLMVGVMLVIPMLFVESLPIQTYVHVLLAAPPPPPPPPPPPMPAPVIKARPRQFNANVLLAPRSIPKEVAMIKEDELPPPSSVGGVIGGVPGGVPGGVMGGVIGGIVAAAAPPPPPPPVDKPVAKKPDVPQQVRVSGAIQAGMLARQVQPEYPLLARRARIEGTVVLKAIIASNGTVKELNLISGQPLLVEAAMNAVRQWLYKPTYLNGQPVEVITEIDVNFHMQSR
ncbi:MAG TPA: energy transducer TonB [Bryobacteraceae bacterium]|nr:energy transducer TonB [Bryobacteraceae bacterium]HUO30051.1 energy transducer TonB [Bryobacteraceae bacterium]